jgi:hypothetical protein
MKKLFFYSILLAIVIFTTCKKDTINTVNCPEPPATIDTDTPNFICKKIGLPSQLTKDTTADEKKNVVHWHYNPANPNEVVYVTYDDVIGSYNFITKQRHYLGNRCLYRPFTNNKGWVVYGRYDDFNIYKVKVNGDSLTKLIYSGGQDPKWDYTDTVINYFYNSEDITKKKIIKMNSKGKKLDSITSLQGGGLFCAYAKKSNKIMYVRYENAILTVFYKDLSINTETVIAINTSAGIKTLDNKDEYVYGFEDFVGIVRYNIATQKREVVLNNCVIENNSSKYEFYSPYIGKNSNKLCLICRLIIPLNKQKWFYEYRAFELDLDKISTPEVNLRNLKEIKIFPK